MRFRTTVSLFLAGGLVLTACQPTIPPEVLQLQPESLELRQSQTRRFDTDDEAKLLASSAAVLQDLGFTLDGSETELGLVVASKNRDATEAGQVAAAVIVAVLFGVAPSIDKEQKIRVSLVTRSMGEEENSTAVRITFQRVVWNDRGQVSRSEALTDAKLYQEFFAKLSKAVFLQAHSI